MKYIFYSKFTQHAEQHFRMYSFHVISSLGCTVDYATLCLCMVWKY